MRTSASKGAPGAGCAATIAAATVLVAACEEASVGFVAPASVAVAPSSGLEPEVVFVPSAAFSSALADFVPFEAPARMKGGVGMKRGAVPGSTWIVWPG